ncbi:MAG TPA: aminotransferase class V-fold PLP-dependent enzyme [Polyangiaceae bacterium]|nr:aminotransferase class V-fold PLP-dependent enzyme [Polyangiaceae bacterium]
MSGSSRPAASPLAARWRLDPGVVFLNHGSFGATPGTVLDLQSELRARMEAEPVRFFVRDLEAMLDRAREALGPVVGAPPRDLAFVPNATTGVNAVLRSLHLEAGDELLTTDHEYNACKNALDFVAERAGARVVVARVPFPSSGEDEVVQAVVSKATSRTRLLLIDHVTSPTGMVLPVERIVRDLAARGIDTLVDAAHAPGMVPLSLAELGAAYYTANCHKWLCTPKGAAILYVRPDRQQGVRPVVISHGANSPRTDRSRFSIEFDWTGTFDVTPVLCIPASIDALAAMVPGGLPAVMARNRALALEARGILCAALGVPPPCPESMIGSLAAVPLPDGKPAPPSPLYGDPLQDVLFERHAIEVPVVPWPAPPKRLIRVSAQLYNTREQYEYLARALAAEL